MMSLRLLPSFRSITPYFKQTSLQTHTTALLMNSKDSSSSSSSSDSSDSDSDKEEQKIQRLVDKTTTKRIEDDDKTPKVSDTTERLHTLLQKINEASQKKLSTVSNEEKDKDIEGILSFVSKKANDANVKPKFQMKNKMSKENTEPSNNTKTVNVAIKPKKIRFSHASEEEKLKQKPHDQQIKQAAKNVAESLGGDTKKTELELLSKALNLKQKSPNEAVQSNKESEKPSDLRDLLSGMKVDSSSPQKVELKPENVRKVMDRVKKASVAESVLYAKSITRPKRHAKPEEVELKVAHSNFGILKDFPKDKKDDMQLPTWDTLEVREMRLSTLTVPQNVFQELIQWTNEGKIWHFPIDNEQGMEGEENVHFSEHVFMERHLKGWCPKRGPIRHFMELVCTGLSKNPYMTVEEKIGHITWYKNYFEDKKELLHELGVLDVKATPVAPTDKKQIEA